MPGASGSIVVDVTLGAPVAPVPASPDGRSTKAYTIRLTTATVSTDRRTTMVFCDGPRGAGGPAERDGLGRGRVAGPGREPACRAPRARSPDRALVGGAAAVSARPAERRPLEEPPPAGLSATVGLPPALRAVSPPPALRLEGGRAAGLRLEDGRPAAGRPLLARLAADRLAAGLPAAERLLAARLAAARLAADRLAAAWLPAARLPAARLPEAPDRARAAGRGRGDRGRRSSAGGGSSGLSPMAVSPSNGGGGERTRPVPPG